METRAGLGVENTKHLRAARRLRASPGVAVRLRGVRDLFGLSQRELARLSGISNGTISLIEQDQVSPSVASLKKLTDALSLTLAEFFTMDLTRPAGPFFGADEMPEIGGGEVSLKLVPAGVRKTRLQVLRELYPPGSDTGEEMLSHEGEEAGVVVRGKLKICVGGKERLLGPGDSYAFDSRIPHRFRNTGTEDAEVVSASTPRTF